jgi:hypothetical protein
VRTSRLSFDSIPFRQADLVILLPHHDFHDVHMQIPGGVLCVVFLFSSTPNHLILFASQFHFNHKIDDREDWDSFWILEGLLNSGLPDYARNLLENFLDQIEQLGFVPNGGRTYCEPSLPIYAAHLVRLLTADLNRSQPPVSVGFHASHVLPGLTTPKLICRSFLFPSLQFGPDARALYCPSSSLFAPQMKLPSRSSPFPCFLIFKRMLTSSLALFLG